MLYRRKIIVLHTIKHSETALIVQCYSNEDGRQSLYLKGKTHHSKFHRLGILDVVIYRKNISTMGAIKEISATEPLVSIRSSIYKTTIAIFVSELIGKCIKETETDKFLFDFLCTSIKLLEHINSGIANFPIHFMTNLCKYLGFMPNNNYNPTTTTIFDIQKGAFVSKFDKYNSSIAMNEDEPLLLNELINKRTENIEFIKCSGDMRNNFAKKNDLIYFTPHGN